MALEGYRVEACSWQAVQFSTSTSTGTQIITAADSSALAAWQVSFGIGTVNTFVCQVDSLSQIIKPDED
eukprot:293777-Hanusia_phi.AAC.1